MRIVRRTSTGHAVLVSMLGLLFAGASTTARAETSMSEELQAQRHLVELGLYAGAFFPSDQHELYDYPAVLQRPYHTAALEVGARAAYLPWPWFGIEIEGAAIPTSTVNDEGAALYTFRGHFLGQIPTRLAPFLLVGTGLLGVQSSSKAQGSDVDLAFHWGGGLKYYFTRDAALRIEGRHIITKGLGPDELTSHIEVLGGLALVLGWHAPKREPVVIDTDHDGIADENDRCPHEAGTAPDGCPPPPPDSDGDGLPDDKDQCPNEAADTPDGCPVKDADGDGVPDDQDKCPKVAAATPDGCPADADGDGILDPDDKCPTEPETKNGFEDDDGCPDELPKQVEKFTGTIKGITFALGSARIRPMSFGTLQAALAVLQEYPSVRVKVRGHTDITGSRRRNLELSQQRADAVRDYLVNKGIAADRFATEGVGPDEPIASNATAAGRNQNRRIEFVVIVGGNQPTSAPAADQPAQQPSASQPTQENKPTAP